MTRLVLAVGLALAAALPAAADPPDTCPVMTANEQLYVCRSGVDRDCVYGYSSGTEFATPTCATPTPQEHR